VPVTFGGTSSFQPMAMHMRPESTLSLYISHSGGEAWNCRAMDHCGAFQTAARPAAGVSGLAPGSIVLDPAIRPGFDGVVVLGSVTASTPYMSEAE